VIGGILLFLIAVWGIGVAALVVLGAIVGYFIGKFLDGEIDTEDLQARAQGRRSSM
jgi:membrane protein YqaA with SNARE-associated domain